MEGESPPCGQNTEFSMSAARGRKSKRSVQYFHTFATRRKKLDLQAFRRAVGAVFGLLIAQDIIDGVFRELSEQNMQLLSSVSSMASVLRLRCLIPWQ